MIDSLPAVVWHLPTAKRPWISSSTLSSLMRRNEARANGNYSEEKLLHREVRASVRRDRARWLDEQVAGGNWKGVRNLMKKPSVKILQLQNTDGKLVGGEEKSNTFAQYLETVQ